MLHVVVSGVVARFGEIAPAGHSGSLDAADRNGRAGLGADQLAQWQLSTVLQRRCFGHTNPRTNSYYVSIKGSWTAPINVTITNLPPLAVYEGIYGGGSIPPGTSDGTHTLAYAVITIDPNTLIVRYAPILSASDGTTQESATEYMLLVTGYCHI